VGKEETVAKWRKMWAGKQDEQKFFFALTGDGSSASTADVTTRPKWAWVRYNEKPDRVSQVLNLRFPGIAQDVPVIVGKQYPHDRYYQILGLNTSLYYMHWSNSNSNPYVVQAHGTTHTWGTGNDPAPIETGNIVNGKVVETSPATMGVHVYSMIYEYEGGLATWSGGDVDLTGFAPGASNHHLYVLISLDVVEQTIRTTSGASVPITVPPTIPTVPDWNIPLAVVKIQEGDTTIAGTEIYDYRMLFAPIGSKSLERNFYQYMHYNEMLWTQHLTGEI
jgi:hypothetical protein